MRKGMHVSEIIVALDVEDGTAARGLVSSLRGEIGWFKVGSRLFTAEGPGVIGMVRDAGGSVFLDLKFHDIPATVAGSVRAACSHGISMLTVHTAGGKEMMRAAAEAAGESGAGRPLVVGVTVLTSMTSADLSDVSAYRGEVEDLVTRRAEKAVEAGLDGVVASVHEAAVIRARMGADFVIVTPGIRPEGSGSQDQKRVSTPDAAVRAGADYLVVGRPIYQASSPVDAARAIRAGIEGSRG